MTLENFTSFEDPKIMKKDLKSLSKDSLKLILPGIHNVEILAEMWNELNKAEIVALYYAAGKKSKAFYGTRNHPEAMPRNFTDLVKEMNNIAFPEIGHIINEWDKKYSSNSGDQIERLEDLDSQIKDVFILSFHEKYVPSKLENPEHPNSWFNHCGNNKKKHVDEIYDLLKFNTISQY